MERIVYRYRVAGCVEVSYYSGLFVKSLPFFAPPLSVANPVQLSILTWQGFVPAGLLVANPTMQKPRFPDPLHGCARTRTP